MLGRREVPPAAVGRVIRVAQRRDLDQVVALWIEMMEFHGEFDERFSLKPGYRRETERHLVESMKSRGSRVFVAEEDGKIIGYVLGGVYQRRPVYPPGTYGFISDMSVSSCQRRSGVGRALAQSMLDWFKKEGVTSVELLTLNANPISNAFWESMGFGSYLRLLRKDF
ncbi:MAG: GNAT family N-acetyltransferase [Chthonomonadales bacterium]